MARDDLSIEEILSLLSAASPRVAEATVGVSPDLLRTRPGPDEWSAVDILAHMRSCSDMWGGAIEKILGGERTFKAINPTTWITGRTTATCSSGPHSGPSRSSGVSSWRRWSRCSRRTGRDRRP